MSKSREVRKARRAIRASVIWLEEVEASLARVAASLPTPLPEMVELEAPRDVAAEMLGVVEHMLREHVEPMLLDLRRLLTITDEQLAEEFTDWEERQ